MIDVRTVVPSDRALRVELAAESVEEAANFFAAFFAGQGFTFARGSAADAHYERGSSVGRVFAGGLVERQKYRVVVTPGAPLMSVAVTSEMSGASGGIIGIMRERKSRESMTTLLATYLTQHIRHNS